MSTAKKPEAPAVLGDAGLALWDRIQGDLADGWELDEREHHYLEQACQLADQVAGLDAAVASDGYTVEGSRGQPVVHPAVAEARQLRLAQHRLLRSLEMEDPAAVRSRLSPASRRASTAAHTRWSSARARGQV